MSCQVWPTAQIDFLSWTRFIPLTKSLPLINLSFILMSVILSLQSCQRRYYLLLKVRMSDLKSTPGKGINAPLVEKNLKKLDTPSQKPRRSSFQGLKGFASGSLKTLKKVGGEAETKGEMDGESGDEMEEEESNKPKKMIDFNEQLNDLKNRTELNLPYTLTQTEDTMFLDKDTIITLEYNYYQNFCKYTPLNVVQETISEKGVLLDEYEHAMVHKLGTHDYQTPENEPHNPMSQWPRESIKNLRDSGVDILKQQKYLKNFQYMTVEGKQNVPDDQQEDLKQSDASSQCAHNARKKRNREDDPLLVEGILAKYKVTNKGTMMRTGNVGLNMGKKFFPSRNGNMQLTRSKDKKLISVCNFDSANKFGDHFKLMAWTTKLVPVEVSPAVNDAMGLHYNSVREHFDQLEEISFVNNCKHVMMTYIEMKMRPLKEQQAFELEMDGQLPSGRKITDAFSERMDPRKGRKHVFFNATTGKKEFEYGGIQNPIEVQNADGKTVKAFELGLLVKEIKEEIFVPQIVILVAGDFLQDIVKQSQIIMDWGMVSLIINAEELFNIDGQDSKLKFIQNKIQEQIPTLQNDFNSQQLYGFDSKWIEQNYFNWEINIKIQANRKFDTYALINSPETYGLNQSSTIYINGPKFMPNETLKAPYYVKLPNDATVNFSKNQLIKDQIFYDLVQNKEVRTYCLRVDLIDPHSRMKCTNMVYSKLVGRHDNFLQVKKNMKTGVTADVFQAISIPRGDQFATLETHVPMTFIGKTPVNFDIVKRNTSQFYQQSGDLPILAYNVGDDRIFLQNIQAVGSKQIFILQMEKDEQFVGFVDFVNYTDIGFYPKDIRVECCSHFLFMTSKKNKNSKDSTGNKLNLLFVDPFYSEFQGAWFKSNTFYDNSIFQNNDLIIKQYVQSNRTSERDTKFKTYIWTQTGTGINRSKMLLPSSKLAEDSDNVMEEADKVLQRMKDDEFNFSTDKEMIPLPMLQNDRGFIYYVVRDCGICYIMEGNPKKPYAKFHKEIFEIKTENCIAFDLGPENFTLMDSDHNVYKLERNQNSRQLMIEQESTMKQILRLDFKPKPFDNLLLNSTYTIFNSKIFYLYNQEDEPFPEGIFEADELIEEDRTQPRRDFIKGPFPLRGSNKFYCVYRQNKFTSSIRIFQLPDMTFQTVINDYQNFVDMSTFLESGQILMKIRKRFMIFTSDAKFIDEVEFNNDNMEIPDEEDELNNSLSNFMCMFQGPVQTETQAAKNKKNEIRDFRGNPYEIAPKEPEPPLNELNKMTLIQFSSNNRFFLFFDKMIEKMIVYELCEVSVTPDEEGSFFDLKNIVTQDDKKSYQFMWKYELQFMDCLVFDHLYSIEIDAFSYFLKNPGQLKISDQGIVKMCYVENIPAIENTGKFIDNIDCRLIGSIFSQNGEKSISKCDNFTEQFQFPKESFSQLAQILENQKEKLSRKLNNLRIRQSRLPVELHDYSEYDELIKDLLEIENVKNENIFAKVYFDDLMIIYCGNLLIFGRLVPYIKGKAKKSKKKDIQQKDLCTLALKKLPNGKYFQSINLNFSKDVEIIKIIETSKQDLLQIVTKDNSTNVFQLITWDFNQNIEDNMFQLVIDETKDVGYHVVKGMNKKLNYFIDQDYLTDLEFNIPIHQRNINQYLDPECVSYVKQQYNINEFYNQNKIFEDQQKFLGVEKAHCLFYPLSRMDILLWQNIQMAGESPDIIKKTSNLDSFNLCFTGISLFHYFAANANVIEIIHQKYLITKTNDQLEGTQNTLPLQILNPDNDGKTALFLSVQNQSPKSFECMVELLSDFPENQISKMILRTFPLILAHESASVINFLDIMLYQPPQMQVEQFIPWSDDYEELIFPSHTTVISRQLLNQKLVELGIISKDSLNQKKKPIDEDELEKPVLSKRELMIQKRKEFRTFELPLGFEGGEDEVSLKRVVVEALDLDWVFKEDNAKTLIKVLASSANNQALTKKSIKCFIDLMWSHYQRAIIRFIFFPYCAYLMIINYLTGFIVDPYYEDLLVLEDPETSPRHTQLRMVAMILTPIAAMLMLSFGSLEIKQLFASGFEYFADYWNCIDMTSLSLNVSFLTMFIYDVFAHDNYFSKQLILMIGSFASFFMWIKVFYWMRLFSALAYYVKLIQQTISDSFNFMFMVLLILVSFANFFFVASKNFDKDSDTYLGSYLDSEVSDSFITIYMLGALGDFNSDAFKQGYMGKEAMIMFLLATFVIAVVFMNMLIAIMGETFGQVLEGQVENGLREQVVLMEDHVWLIDLKKIFKGQRTILRVAPSSSGSDEVNEVVNQVSESRDTMLKRIEKMHNALNKRIDQNDQNSRFMLQNQYDLTSFTLSRIRDVDQRMRESMQAQDDERNQVSAEDKQLKLHIEQKKELFYSQLNAQMGAEELGKDAIRSIAITWMEAIDTDKSGQVEYEEFYEFFQKLEGVNFTEVELKQMFKDFDKSGDGGINIEEFARIIAMSIIPEGRDGEATERRHEPIDEDNDSY